MILLQNFHPGIFMIIMGLLIMALPKEARKPLSIAAPVVALAMYFTLKESSSLLYNVTSSLQLELLGVDRLSQAFVLIFCIIAVVDAVYAADIQDKIETGMSLFYAGSIISIALAGDVLSFIVFWEMAAFSAVYLIYARHCRRSSRSAFRYLLMHAFGGSMLLAGFLLNMYQTGGTAIPQFDGQYDNPAFWLILIGVGVNAVIPPLNSWIVDAYPEATIGGTVYMGGYTTKIGIYALIRMFAGTEFLLYVGVFMALYGVCMALLENDLRRLFCYHIISQLGYMIASLACANAFGMDGATAHAFNHILYKGTLLMCAGAVIYATGRRKISDLSGLHKEMPLTAWCFLIASFSISGVPLLNGFVSKALITEAVSESGHPLMVLGLTVASVGTWLSVALKVNWFIFFGKPANQTIAEKAAAGEAVLPVPRVKPIPVTMKIAMVMGSAACVVTGLFPQLVYSITPNQSDGHPFTFHHVAEYICLFVAATVVFFALRKIMSPHDEFSLDFDWIFRKPLFLGIKGLSAGLYAFMDVCDKGVLKAMQAIGPRFGNPYLWTKNSVNEKVRHWSFENEDKLIGDIIGTAVAMVAVFFVIFVAI